MKFTDSIKYAMRINEIANCDDEYITNAFGKWVLLSPIIMLVIPAWMLVIVVLKDTKEKKR